MEKLTVEFYGLLKDITATDVLETEKYQNLDELKQHLFKMYPEIEKHIYVISVNNVLVKENIKLENCNKIVFMPPFSGG